MLLQRSDICHKPTGGATIRVCRTGAVINRRQSRNVRSHATASAAVSDDVLKTGRLTPELVHRFNEQGYLALPGMVCKYCLDFLCLVGMPHAECSLHGMDSMCAHCMPCRGDTFRGACMWGNLAGFASQEECDALKQRMGKLLDAFDPTSVKSVFSTKNQKQTTGRFNTPSPHHTGHSLYALQATAHTCDCCTHLPLLGLNPHLFGRTPHPTPLHTHPTH